ncbi:hypothetical protein SAMN02745724_04888 [Pseudoalteromonas denitrificans DSM 6059]|uniref:Uncharacterized protein n=1 Tax=Pseudoalteromonas denitrificans DSM 6059 TaxID=1123010 RepID=A0A1I1TGH1_9GAMM|nr:hypothetical protein SAMN02745724_04888 [Pseudoalteromonas denitrificans DSM 6059]
MSNFTKEKLIAHQGTAARDYSLTKQKRATRENRKYLRKQAELICKRRKKIRLLYKFIFISIILMTLYSLIKGVTALRIPTNF